MRTEGNNVASTAKSKAKAKTQSTDFETSISRLAEIVEQLESGELPLEQSLTLFEEGIGLARASQKTLDSAEKRVEQLLGYDKTGEPIVEELDVDDNERE
jgi:exodeoxyribonuclease VII small subunit